VWAHYGGSTLACGGRRSEIGGQIGRSAPHTNNKQLLVAPEGPEPPGYLSIAELKTTYTLRESAPETSPGTIEETSMSTLLNEGVRVNSYRRKWLSRPDLATRRRWCEVCQTVLLRRRAGSERRCREISGLGLIIKITKCGEWLILHTEKTQKRRRKECDRDGLGPDLPGRGCDGALWRTICQHPSSKCQMKPRS
jgi:hypothetical protein